MSFTDRANNTTDVEGLNQADAEGASTANWQSDLHKLFVNAKDRFPDIVWSFTGITSTYGDGEESFRLRSATPKDSEPTEEEVWGHKAIIYARAPPSFQSRYFQPEGRFREYDEDEEDDIDSPLPSSPLPSTHTQSNGLLRLNMKINPILFSNELEYLYTGEGFGEAFEFLFDTSASNPSPDDRIDKLRKDLVFMWRSRLYSDVRLALTGEFSSSHGPGQGEETAIFSSHRFILVSRCSYFADALLSWPQPQPSSLSPRAPSTTTNEAEPLTLSLPSPPFTPPSLHFTLGYIYTGTLSFSHRTFDLTTALAIIKSALYLSLPSLTTLAISTIEGEMTHGLFHARLPFAQYEALTGGRWGMMRPEDSGKREAGCTCKQCARRIPRILEFSQSADVKSAVPTLDRGARRGMVGLFGEGWCTQEFSSLPKNLKESALKGVCKRCTPINALPMLFASHTAQQKLQRMSSNGWVAGVEDYINKGQTHIAVVLASSLNAIVSSSPEWEDLMTSDGTHFTDGDKIEWISSAILGAIRSSQGLIYAGAVYQCLVSQVLIRPHPDDPEVPLLSADSFLRNKIETLRLSILNHIRPASRWQTVRDAGGFALRDEDSKEEGDGMDAWALKEIADFLDLPLETIVSDPSMSLPTLNGATSTISRALSPHLRDDASSMRVSILSRNLPTTSAKSVRSVSGASVRSSVRPSKIGTNDSASTRSSRRVVTPTQDRPDSKLTPPPSSLSPTLASSIGSKPGRPISTVPEDSSRLSISVTDDSFNDVSSSPPQVPKSAPPLVGNSPRSPTLSISSVSSRKSTVSTASRKSTVSTIGERPKSSSSARSTSTVKTSRPSFNLNTSSPSPSPSTSRLRPPPISPRPSSSVSTSTSGSTTFKTAPTGTRSRTTSSTSTASARSTTSVRSTTSTSTNTRSSPAIKRPPSIAPSVRSTRSTKTTAPPLPIRTPPQEKKVVVLKRGTPTSASNRTSTATLNIKRKGSGDTITSKVSRTSAKPVPAPKAEVEGAQGKETTTPDVSDKLGATLSIGIPCIISSHRRRFRALARYIGELEGEKGNWVGVEVPVSSIPAGHAVNGFGVDGMSSSMPSNGDTDVVMKDAEGRQWNDGTWAGVRYFSTSQTAAPFGQDDYFSFSSRARPMMNQQSSSLKRTGEYLSPNTTGGSAAERANKRMKVEGNIEKTRGLFVRPQQVLYVVDAIDGDL